MVGEKETHQFRRKPLGAFFTTERGYFHLNWFFFAGQFSPWRAGRSDEVKHFFFVAPKLGGFGGVSPRGCF